jgi:hypothetical protein
VKSARNGSGSGVSGVDEVVMRQASFISGLTESEVKGMGPWLSFALASVQL